MRTFADSIEKAIKADPNFLAALKLHFLKWVLFDIGGETYFMYQGIFDTDFDKYTDDAVALFGKARLSTSFENLEREDWPRGHFTTARSNWTIRGGPISARLWAPAQAWNTPAASPEPALQ
jgi:hypothetical protein